MVNVTFLSFFKTNKLEFINIKLDVCTLYIVGKIHVTSTHTKTRNNSPLATQKSDPCEVRTRNT